MANEDDCCYWLSLATVLAEFLLMDDEFHQSLMQEEQAQREKHWLPHEPAVLWACWHTHPWSCQTSSADIPASHSGHLKDWADL